MQHIMPYNLDDDPVIAALRAEGAADPDVIGILVTGSRGVGAVTTESDYDVIFIVSDETEDRYAREPRAAPWGYARPVHRHVRYAVARVPTHAPRVQHLWSGRVPCGL
jgi:hypothetical protein